MKYLSFAMFFVLISGLPHARAELPPPTITPFARPTLTTTTKPVPVAPLKRHSAPADGPMCGPAIAEPVVGLEPPTQFAVLIAEPATEAEYTFIANAIDACSGLRGPVQVNNDPFTALALYRLEGELGAPHGLLIGTWCVETAMRAKPSRGGKQFLGDWKDGKPRASGPLQLHENVWGTTCHGTPDAPHDLFWAAACYWTEVLRVEAKARRIGVKCPEADMLRVAEAAAANVRRYGWRCDSRSAHWGMSEAMR